MNRTEEAKIRKMVQGEIEKALKAERKRRANELKTELKLALSKHEKEMKEFIQKEWDKLDKDKMSKEDVKDIIAKAFMRQYRFMWEKGKFVTSYLKSI